MVYNIHKGGTQLNLFYKFRCTKEVMNDECWLNEFDSHKTILIFTYKHTEIQLLFQIVSCDYATSVHQVTLETMEKLI